MKFLHRPWGYTLTELIAVTGIMGLLSLTVFPSVQGMLDRQATTTAINRMVVAVHVTRHSALIQQTRVTLCSLKASGKCGNNWADELTVFKDRNGNARLDAGEVIIRQLPPLQNKASITWRAFQNRQYLQMTPMGFTHYQNGNFVACPADGNPRWAKQIVINLQGRVRNNRRVNEAGMPIDYRGRLLRC